MTWGLLLQAAVSGLLLGGVYGLVASGLSLIFGVLRIINFAHGAVMMLGMYTTYWLFTLAGVDPYLSVILTAPLFFALGVVIAYVILPFAAQFLLSFTTPDFQPLITAGAYFDFVTTLFLAFGLVMEFPILLVGLSRVGILTSQRLTAAPCV